MRKIMSKFVCLFVHNGFRKAKLLRRLGQFSDFGNNCFYHPRTLPSEPYLVEIGNNVTIATGVYFCTHDINHVVLNNADSLEYIRKGGEFKWHTGKIVVEDNVFIGAFSTIKYGVRIGPNAIVAMGSNVVKDVPEGTIVGGNPAKVIGDFFEYAERMREKDFDE